MKAGWLPTKVWMARLTLDDMLLSTVVWNYVWHFRKPCLSPAPVYVRPGHTHSRGCLRESIGHENVTHPAAGIRKRERGRGESDGQEGKYREGGGGVAKRAIKCNIKGQDGLPVAVLFVSALRLSGYIRDAGWRSRCICTAGLLKRQNKETHRGSLTALEVTDRHGRW